MRRTGRFRWEISCPKMVVKRGQCFRAVTRNRDLRVVRLEIYVVTPQFDSIELFGSNSSIQSNFDLHSSLGRQSNYFNRTIRCSRTAHSSVKRTINRTTGPKSHEFTPQFDSKCNRTISIELFTISYLRSHYIFYLKTGLVRLKTQKNDHSSNNHIVRFKRTMCSSFVVQTNYVQFVCVQTNYVQFVCTKTKKFTTR